MDNVLFEKHALKHKQEMMDVVSKALFDGVKHEDIPILIKDIIKRGMMDHEVWHNVNVQSVDDVERDKVALGMANLFSLLCITELMDNKQ
jgi:hypothetical protein